MKTISSEIITPSRACELLGLDHEILSLDRAARIREIKKHKSFAGNFRDKTDSHMMSIAADLDRDPSHLMKDGTPARINQNGTLKDGQHRIACVVILNIPIEMFVQYVSDDWWGDRGKKRTDADYVKSKLGKLPSHSKFVAAAKMMGSLLKRDLAGFRSSTDPGNIDTICTDWRDELEWAIANVHDRWSATPRPMTSGGAACVAAFALARRSYREQAESLLNRCKSQNNPAVDNASALRRFIGRHAGPGSDAKCIIFCGVATAIKAEATLHKKGDLAGKPHALHSIRNSGSVEEIRSAMSFLVPNE